MLCCILVRRGERRAVRSAGERPKTRRVCSLAEVSHGECTAKIGERQEGTTVKVKKAGAGSAGATTPDERPMERGNGVWSEAAARVLRERYLLRDAQGDVVETPDELCWRVASAVAQAETPWAERTGESPQTMAERFYEVMARHQFLPNSPTLMNAGKGNNLQLSACYVVPVEDSLQGIFDAVQH